MSGCVGVEIIVELFGPDGDGCCVHSQSTAPASHRIPIIGVGDGAGVVIHLNRSIIVMALTMALITRHWSCVQIVLAENGLDRGLRGQIVRANTESVSAAELTKES